MTKTLKEICQEFYDNWQGEKKSFNSFYQQARCKTLEEMAEIIVPKKPIPKARKYNGEFVKEYEWYQSLNNVSIPKKLFLQRLKQGFTKEQAILSGDEWQQVLIEKRKNKIWEVKKHKFEKQETGKINEDYYGIKIKLPEEEAEIFRKEYLSLMNYLEEELENIEEEVEKEIVSSKLERLKCEVRDFNSINNERHY